MWVATQGRYMLNLNGSEKIYICQSLIPALTDKTATGSVTSKYSCAFTELSDIRVQRHFNVSMAENSWLNYV